MSPELPLPDLSIFDHCPNDVERCGVIVLAAANTHEIVEMPNRAPYPADDFLILNSDIHLLVPSDAVIVGVVHTHPDGSSAYPSTNDVLSIPAGLIGMVYHPSTTSVSWYDGLGLIEHWKRRKRR